MPSMDRELVAGFDAATPMVPVGVKAQLKGLGGVNAFEANYGRANHQRVAVGDPRRARQISSLGQRAGELGSNDDDYLLHQLLQTKTDRGHGRQHLTPTLCLKANTDQSFSILIFALQGSTGRGAY